MSETLLELTERNRLVDTVAGLYDFTDQGPRGRRIFIQVTAGLGRFSSTMDLSGNPGTVAGDLIMRLEEYGTLPERPTYHALGALLNALLNVKELNREAATFVAGLIVRYSLVADPPFLKKLREQYAIADESVREPPKEAVTPAIGAAEAPAGPEFDPRIEDQTALESIINSEDNFLDIHLLIGALYSSKAVGRIEMNGEASGTGFLIGPDLMLTNQHVLKEQAYLEEAVVRFDYLKDTSGVATGGRPFSMEHDFYFASPPLELDYALVRLREKPLAHIAAEGELAAGRIEDLLWAGKHRGYLTLAPRTMTDRSRVNILQHPDGDPLKVVLTQNYVVNCTDNRLQYVADTMEGSSGSPVFNHTWEVVALHHSGAPYPKDDVTDVLKRVWKGRFRVNEGISVRTILKDFDVKGITRYLPKD